MSLSREFNPIPVYIVGCIVLGVIILVAILPPSFIGAASKGKGEEAITTFKLDDTTCGYSPCTEYNNRFNAYMTKRLGEDAEVSEVVNKHFVNPDVTLKSVRIESEMHRGTPRIYAHVAVGSGIDVKVQAITGFETKSVPRDAELMYTKDGRGKFHLYSNLDTRDTDADSAYQDIKAVIIGAVQTATDTLLDKPRYQKHVNERAKNDASYN